MEDRLPGSGLLLWCCDLMAGWRLLLFGYYFLATVLWMRQKQMHSPIYSQCLLFLLRKLFLPFGLVCAGLFTKGQRPEQRSEGERSPAQPHSQTASVWLFPALWEGVWAAMRQAHASVLFFLSIGTETWDFAHARQAFYLRAASPDPTLNNLNRVDNLITSYMPGMW